jgi:hypothetical protein
MTPLEITLGATPPDATSNAVYVCLGRSSSVGTWYLDLSGTPGILFADGSFEFRGVSPGRHVILLEDRPANPTRMLAASVVVGTADLGNVLVDETRVLPAEIRFPASTPAPGSIPLPWIFGKVVDEQARNRYLEGPSHLQARRRQHFRSIALASFKSRDFFRKLRHQHRRIPAQRYIGKPWLWGTTKSA